jgi:hypothetical protein
MTRKPKKGATTKKVELRWCDLCGAMFTPKEVRVILLDVREKPSEREVCFPCERQYRWLRARNK